VIIMNEEDLDKLAEKMDKIIEILEEFKDALYCVYYGGRLGPFDVRVMQ